MLWVRPFGTEPQGSGAVYLYLQVSLSVGLVGPLRKARSDGTLVRFFSFSPGGGRCRSLPLSPRPFLKRTTEAEDSGQALGEERLGLSPIKKPPQWKR